MNSLTQSIPTSEIQTTISALRPGDLLEDAGSWLKVERIQERRAEVIVFAKGRRPLYFRPHRRCVVRRHHVALVPGDGRLAAALSVVVYRVGLSEAGL